MPDPIYVDSIKVSAGPFTIKTGRGCPVVQYFPDANPAKGRGWILESVEDLELLYAAIGEYLHMRGMEDA